MSTASFTVEFDEPPPLENVGTHPFPKPTFAMLTALGPHGVRVHGQAAMRKYVQDCAVALARACRGKVTSSTGKPVADFSGAPETLTVEQLKAA
jgi:hypothetical protein